MLKISRNFPKLKETGFRAVSASYTTNSHILTEESAIKRHLEANQISLQDPARFWLNEASKIDWFKKPTKAYDPSNILGNLWFPDGETNLCYLALDANIAKGRGNDVALIHENHYTGATTPLTYNQLHAMVNDVTGGLVKRGLKRGDHVLIYMPMVPEAAASMLACARLGIIHTVVFAGFAPHELAKRIANTQPKLIFTATSAVEPSGPIPLVDLVSEALQQTEHRVREVVVLERPHVAMSKVKATGVTTTEWHNSLGSPHDAVPLPASAPSYIIHTSGTTGAPKGIQRDIGGYAVALQYSMREVYKVPQGAAWLGLSDIGWLVGHSFIVYGPLITGNPSIMIEGKPMIPDAGVLWRTMAKHKVHSCFVAPTALRAIKKLDPALSLRPPLMADNATKAGVSQSTADASVTPLTLQQMFLAGERADADTLRWVRAGFPGVAVRDHYWATEFGWPAIVNAEKVAPEGSAGFPVAGYDFHVVDDEGKAVPKNVPGNLVLRMPLPPGVMQTVYGDETRYKKGYLEHFPGFFNTGDGAFRDQQGRFFITGRTDDVFNTAGHRLTTSNIEEAAATASSDVAELCCVGVPDVMGIKGEVPALFVVMKSGKVWSKDVEKAIVAAVRHEVGHIATPAYVLEVKRLPKTRSGKIVRKTIREIFAFVAAERGLGPLVAEKTVIHGANGSATVGGQSALNKEKKTVNGVNNPGTAGLGSLEKWVKIPATIEDAGVIPEMYDTLSTMQLFDRK